MSERDNSSGDYRRSLVVSKEKFQNFSATKKFRSNEFVQYSTEDQEREVSQVFTTTRILPNDEAIIVLEV
ncbi:15298_t:CDS:2 [Funneliformis caledonium]|uniref:15298_t:CDS:1 n=1 Tax=Funneliformis caledonium TaxID=1117310 RepID=A0A9N9E627_9GLOM|nr:15298_t:CDS:2 [Funneliformis caledonium]